jgi:hypothetical protein
MNDGHHPHLDRHRRSGNLGCPDSGLVQSVTTSARATCVADNRINAAKKRVAAQLAWLRSRSPPVGSKGCD